MRFKFLLAFLKIQSHDGQSAKLNGKSLNQAWFRHTDIKDGGEMELLMGNEPSDWGSEKLPPSILDL